MPALAEQEKAPVLIVGAGPTGLTLALQLKAQGLTPIVIEKQKAGQYASKAIALHGRTLEILDRLDLTDCLLKKGHKVESLAAYADGKRLFRASVGSLDGPFPYILHLAQSETEQILEQAALERGVIIRRGWVLEDLETASNAVVAVVRKPQGKSHLRAQYICACDGQDSALARLAGLTSRHSSGGLRYAVADGKLHWPQSPDTWHAYFHREGYVIFLPLGGHEWRIMADLSSGADPVLEPEAFEEIAMTRGAPPMKFEEMTWSSSVSLILRRAEAFRAGRLVFAGDAAQTHAPIGSQGMNMGIQDAANLAWKLASVLRKEADDSLLDSYSQERVRARAAVDIFTQRMHRMARMRGFLGRRFRDALLPACSGLELVRRRFVRQLENHSLHYRGSILTLDHVNGASARPITKHSGPPEAGDWAPDVLVTSIESDQARALRELISIKRPTVLLFLGPANSSLSTAEAERILHALAAEPEVEIIIISSRRAPPSVRSEKAYFCLDPRRLAHDRYGALAGANRTGLFVIRPDGYIGLRCLPASWDVLRLYLKRLRPADKLESKSPEEEGQAQRGEINPAEENCRSAS